MINERYANKSREKYIEFDLFSKEIDKNDDFSLQKEGRAKKYYNFSVRDGALKNGYGFKKVCFPNTDDMTKENEIETYGKIKGIWSHRWFDSMDRVNKFYLFYYNDAGEMHWKNIFAPYIVKLREQLDFSLPLAATSYRYNGHDILVFSAKEGTFVASTTTLKSTTLPRFVSCCAALGHLFAIVSDESRDLIYADNMEISNWTNENSHDIPLRDVERGSPIKLITLNDYLFVFREFGITKIVALASTDEYKVSQVYLSDSRIYANSICSSGSEIYFLAEDGFYRFNGNRVEKFTLECEKLFANKDNSSCYGICYAGKYYLACNLDFGDEGKENNSLLVIDLENKSVDITYGVNITMLCVMKNTYKDKVLACFGDEEHNSLICEITEDGKFFGQPCEKVWQSIDFDLDSNEIKRAYAIELCATCDCDVTIESDRESKTYHVEGNENKQTINTNVLGKMFNVQFKTNESENTKISNAKVKFRVKA